MQVQAALYWLGKVVRLDLTDPGLINELSINYSIGNLEHVKGDQRDAKRHYDEALNVFIRSTPMHILTSCTFYKLGCCEAKLGNIERAQ